MTPDQKPVGKVPDDLAQCVARMRRLSEFLTSKGLVNAAASLDGCVRYVQGIRIHRVARPGPRGIERVYDAVQQGHATVSDIVAATGIVRHSVSAYLYQLRVMGLVAHVGDVRIDGKKWAVYEPVERQERSA